MSLQWVRGGICRYFQSPNTSISRIIDLLRTVDEWAEIALSGRKKDENENCETLKKLVHKWNFHH